MTSYVSTAMLHLAWLMVLLLACCFAVQGHPVTPMAKLYRDFETPHGVIEIEISPYVFKEFIKAPVKSQERRPIPSASQPETFKMHFSSSSSSLPVIFEDDPISQNDEDSYQPDHHSTSDKRNTVKNGSEGSKNKKDTSNDASYIQRFLSKNVSSNECPKGHTYSKLQKRCMKRYTFTDSSIG